MFSFFYDELDLVTGKVRVKQGGGSGGHNGIKDIDARIGKNYHRIRVGIDHPGDKNKVSSYVLHPFSKEQWNKIEPVFWSIGEHVPSLLKGEASLFMSRISEQS
jgi:PTH1 family peptidyl-tRNA hydrolase